MFGDVGIGRYTQEGFDWLLEVSTSLSVVGFKGPHVKKRHPKTACRKFSTIT